MKLINELIRKHNHAIETLQELKNCEECHVDFHRAKYYEALRSIIEDPIRRIFDIEDRGLIHVSRPVELQES